MTEYGDRKKSVTEIGQPKSVNQNRSTEIGHGIRDLKKSVSEIGHEKHKIGHRLKDRPLLPQDVHIRFQSSLISCMY